MHLEARQFLEKVKSLFPEFFNEKRVIDIGSGDINGNNKYMFENCEYVGVDVVPAPNVDIVSYAKDLPDSVGQFDVVVSSECFEHDMQIFHSLYRILKLLKDGGLFFFTCANVGRWEHGTKRTSPGDSYSTNLNTSDWYPNYYQNLSMDDICKMIKLQDYFNIVHFENNTDTHDLYFYGIRNNNTNYQNVNYLEEKFRSFDTDKKAEHHNYTRQYDQLLSKFRYKNINILEIGISNGASLYALRDAFPNAIKVVGIDPNQLCKIFESPDMGIYIETGNQSDQEFLNNVVLKHGPFDLIIDDGTHINNDVILSFETLFPLLKNEGLYVVEDTVCYKVNQFINNKYPNHLTYFANLLPFLNQWNMGSVDPFKIEKKTSNLIECGIDKIEFGCSYIGIHKLIREHWLNTI